MSITLVPAPLFNVHSSFHYTEDNDRLAQLNANDLLLANQVNQILGGANGSMTVVGNWATLAVILDTTGVADNSPFGIEAKVWGIENLTSISSQNAFLFSILIFGYRDTSSNLQLSGTAPVYSQNIGAKVVTPVVSIVGNNINIKVTGFTGANGKMSGRVNNFG